MLEQYIKMMKELKTLGEQIMEDDEVSGFEPWFEEIAYATEQLRCSLSILKKATAE